ncbi:MAG: substrate-binding domain-containing protein [Ruminococcus sp.]|jgi:ABC-type phosphate transport system substrate-binding protein|nr:substrate-binding domain-containing protein [Ruminococcus sp.]
MFKKISAIFLSALLSITFFTAATPEKEEYPFPTIDGSTSTVRLDGAIRAHYSGKSVDDETYSVDHSKTFESFEKLLAGEVDIVLSVPLSKEQRALIPEDFKLGEEKIALEGFVFLINPENPVKSLTQVEIRDIYAGKITNWSEVGGDDAEIIAYQRNTDSGSQTYMTEFMGKTPLASAPKERVPAEMGHMITLLSAYDNSKYAIGYSVYSYAAEKQISVGNLGLLAVDGIAPSRETFVDGSYPLLSATYAFYNKDNENPRVKEVVDFIISAEGQKVVADAGYYPVKATKLPSDFVPYKAVGTGKAKPSDYKPVPYFSYYNLPYEIDDTEIVNQLTNEKLAGNIKAYLENLPDDASPWLNIRNGYLSFTNSTESVVFDMFTGEKIEKFSDLFYKDSDFVPVLNEVFAAYHLSYYDYYMPRENDFVGIIGEPTFDIGDFTLNPEYNNVDYANCAYYTDQNDDLLDFLVIYEYRDMSECFLPEYRKYIEDRDWLPYYTEEGIYKDGKYYFQVQSRYEDVKLVNKQLLAACEAFYENDYYPVDERDLSDGFKVEILKNCFQIHYAGNSMYFDRKTGKLLTFTDIFKKGFAEKYSKLNPDYSEAVFTDSYCFWFYEEDGRMNVCTTPIQSAKINNTIWFSVNKSDIKSKYADIFTDSYMAP